MSIFSMEFIGGVSIPHRRVIDSRPPALGTWSIGRDRSSVVSAFRAALTSSSKVASERSRNHPDWEHEQRPACPHCRVDDDAACNGSVWNESRRVIVKESAGQPEERGVDIVLGSLERAPTECGTWPTDADLDVLPRRGIETDGVEGLNDRISILQGGPIRQVLAE